MYETAKIKTINEKTKDTEVAVVLPSCPFPVVVNSAEHNYKLPCSYSQSPGFISKFLLRKTELYLKWKRTQRLFQRYNISEIILNLIELKDN